MRNALNLLIFSLTTFVLQPDAGAQAYSEKWSFNPLQSLSGLVVGDMLEAMDGKLVVVGEVISNESSKGCFLLINDATGKVERQFSALGNERYNSLKACVQAEDGSFVVVGSAGGTPADQDAWLMRISPQGQVLFDTLYRSAGHDAFEKIILAADGSLLIAGCKNGAENIWLSRRQFHKVLLENNRRDKRFGRLLHLSEDESSGQIRMAGAPKRNESAWTLQWDEQLRPVGDHFYVDLSRSEPVFLDFAASNSLHVIGHTWSKGNDDIWLAHLFSAPGSRSESIVGTRNPEYVRAAARLSPNRYVLSMSALARSVGELHGQLVVYDAVQRRIIDTFFQLGSEQKLVATHLLPGARRRIWLAGLNTEGKEYRSVLRCLDPTTPVAVSKAINSIRCSAPELSDETGDGRMSPGERGAIVFYAENTGDADITDAEIQVRTLTPLAGLDLEYSTLQISHLARGSKKRLSIPVYAGSNLGNSTAVFEVQIVYNGAALAKLQAKVSSAQAGGGGNTAPAVWGLEFRTESGNRNARSAEDRVKVVGKIYADKIIPEENFRSVINGNLTMDARNESAQYEVEEENGHFVHKFSMTIPLREGDNTARMSVLVDGVSHESELISIQYKSRQPNLHLIVIAPDYKDLKYNRQDTEDVIAALMRQKGLGLYNDVFVTRLSGANVSKIQMELAFRQLAESKNNSDDERTILEKDIVMVYVSSHGTVVKGRFKIVPGDFITDYPEESSVDYRSAILEPLEKIRCKKLIFIDACHSGGAKSRMQPNEKDINSAIEDLSRIAEGVTTITSSGPAELSYEESSWQNGAFTEAFLDALANRPMPDSARPGLSLLPDANGDRLLSLEELYQYISRRVPQLIREVHRNNADLMPQHPLMLRNDWGDGVRVFVVE